MRKCYTPKNVLLAGALLLLTGGVGLASKAAEAQQVPPVPGAPPIVATPILDVPQLLQWPIDPGRGTTPNLTDQPADRLYDLHGDIGACNGMGLVLSTEGNYNMALQAMWYHVFLPRYGRLVKTWYYTTSPPISVQQLANSNLTFGNLNLACHPEIAVASMRVMKKLEAAGDVQGKPRAIIQGRGNVLLVKAGNPKGIHSIWDLGRTDVRLMTPNPYLEPGAFLNYATSIYEIAKQDAHPPAGWTADRLFNAIFGAAAPKGKWLIGDRIHHRDEPQAVAYGGADVAVIMYQLGHYTMASFPHLLTIVPLGGTVSDPQPLPGNQVGMTYMAKIRGNWTPAQRAAANDLWATYNSPAFTKILEQYGLRRPAGWKVAKSH